MNVAAVGEIFHDFASAGSVFCVARLISIRSAFRPPDDLAGNRVGLGHRVERFGLGTLRRSSGIRRSGRRHRSRSLKFFPGISALSGARRRAYSTQPASRHTSRDRRAITFITPHSPQN